ncbi:hypothetical protein ABIC76_001516 [Ralstonia sp. 1138]
MRRRWYEIFSMQIVLTTYTDLQRDSSGVDAFANAKRVHWLECAAGSAAFR